MAINVKIEAMFMNYSASRVFLKNKKQVFSKPYRSVR